MATFKSNLRKFRHRGLYEGQPNKVGGRIALKTGTVLTIGDHLIFGELGENLLVKEVSSFAVGNTGAAAVSIGYAQILDKAGNPVSVERLGPLGASSSKYVSPVSDPDAFAAAAVLSTPRVVVNTNDIKLAGPVYLIAEVTTGATLAADCEVFIGAEVDGEIGTHQVLGNDPDASYLLP